MIGVMDPFVTPAPDDSRTTRERMLAGEWYNASDPDLQRRAHRAFRLSEEYRRAWFSGNFVAARGLLTDLVGDLGEEAEVRPPFLVDYGENITIGPRTFANYNLVALDVAPIAIGADVQIGPNVQLLTPIHPLEAEARRDKWEAARPIVIEDNVWLGGGVIVGPGVRIGANTVVGAGSVVLRDLPPGVLAAGNPARVIRDLA